MSLSKKFIKSLYFVCLSIGVSKSAPLIENVYVAQDSVKSLEPLGWTGTLTYDLSGSLKDSSYVWLEMSFDQGATWTRLDLSSEGDVGFVEDGMNKNVRWSWFGDHFINENFYQIRVNAEDEYGPCGVEPQPPLVLKTSSSKENSFQKLYDYTITWESISEDDSYTLRQKKFYKGNLEASTIFYQFVGVDKSGFQTVWDTLYQGQETSKFVTFQDIATFDASYFAELELLTFDSCGQESEPASFKVYTKPPEIKL